MKSLVRWAIDNSPAMNTLMVSVLVVGTVSLFFLRREDFPRFDLEIILVTVPYPGASPEEVENGVCQKVEEAVRSIDGLKKVTSIAMEGSGSVILEVKTDVPNVQKVLAEVESEIDRIPSFPELTEEPEIRQLTLRNPTIMIGVVGPDDVSAAAELRLRDVVENVRDELLGIPEISVAEIQGARDYQIDVEISETTLRAHGLSLQEVARRIRRENLELPGGKITSDSQELLLRGKAKRLRGDEIERIPLITTSDGVVLTVGDLGTVRDDFTDTTSISRINRRPGMAISIEAAAREDMLAMTKAVRDYAAATELPAGYSFELWGDRSIDVDDRLQLLIRNGGQGLILVFIALALFLELRLAFWVALGIPISILGACALLWQFDQTLNMLSMFSFVIALGIVVDDAIVIGENIYAHREMDKNFVNAAIEGTYEVLPSVAASITTTVFAFLPMFFVTGTMGKFFAVMPLAVIAMLIISLVESALILPCHLAHSGEPGHRRLTLGGRIFRSLLIGGIVQGACLLLGRLSPGLFVPTMAAAALTWTFVLLWIVVGDSMLAPFRRIHDWTDALNSRMSRLLELVIHRLYLPTLRRALRFPAVTTALAVAFLLISFSLVRNGTVPWLIFPKMDARRIEARVIFPDGTPSHVTDAATRRLEDAMLRIGERHAEQGEPLLRMTYRLVGQVSSSSPGAADERTEGGHAGSVQAAIVESTERTTTSFSLVDEWREEVGQIPGAETLTFNSLAMSPGGKPIEFKLLASSDRMSELEAATEECKQYLARQRGVIDLADDSRPGKWEYQLTVKEDARTLGVSLQDLAGTVRAAYYGEEVMRLQRGRHEVKLMVRYPSDQRRSVVQFEDLRVDTGDGVKRPLAEIAHVNIERGYSEINRVDQQRSITVTADVDDAGMATADAPNAAQIVSGDAARPFCPELLVNAIPTFAFVGKARRSKPPNRSRALFHRTGDCPDGYLCVAYDAVHILCAAGNHHGSHSRLG